jgi:hypothetical protein
MKSIFKVLLCVCALSVGGAGAAYAGIFGPATFDECILESMKGVTSDFAAKAIYASCLKKFPRESSPKSVSIDVPPSVLSALAGHASKGIGDNFTGNIYNGNSKWVITQFTLRLKPKSSTLVKDYIVSELIDPLTSEDFFVSIDAGADKEFDWDISSAKGYQKP